MGRASRVDHAPMDNDLEGSGVELSSSADYSLKIHDDEDVDAIAGMYGASGASLAVAGDGLNDLGKHEHLMRSGPMGRCNDPFCATCPSYFGYSEVSPTRSSDQIRNDLLVRARVLQGKAAVWSKRWGPGILNPHTKMVQRWNKIFCISSLIAIFVDPIFFFLLAVDSSRYCLYFNNAAAVAVTVVRTLTDCVHVFHIILQFRLAYVLPASKVRGAGELEDNPRRIAVHYLQTWFILDLFTALPLPQILIWTVVKKMLGKESGANYAKDTLRVVVLVQNIPRSLRFFPLLIGRSPSGFVFETAWANFVINLLMYLLAGHIVGSTWYLLGLQRVNQCLEDICESQSGLCKKSYLDCGSGQSFATFGGDSGNYTLWLQNTNISQTCFPVPSSPSTFAYGIYQVGVLVVQEQQVINRYIYSVFWGFQQISTLAGNLIPSTFPWEVLFTMGIVGLGLLLFALLIGNMQNFLQALGKRKLDMQLKRYDTEAWMKQRRLPLSLRRRVKQAGRFRWVATGGVEERELLGDLPEDLQKDIQRYLCLELVKKVRLFKLLEDHVLDGICERLYQKLYIDHSVVFRAKRPVERMLFIVRESWKAKEKMEVLSNLRREIFVEKSCCLGTSILRVSAKLMGTHQSRGKHPLSSRTVTCLTSVEAFSLDSGELEYITTHYKAAFRSPRVQGIIRYLSLYWRTLAVTRIQRAWRLMKARQGASRSAGPNRGRKFTRFATVNRVNWAGH